MVSRLVRKPTDLIRRANEGAMRYVVQDVRWIRFKTVRQLESKTGRLFC